MEKMWGDSVVKLRADDAQRGQLFADGNYAMFIHWGIYSQLANEVDGKTYYGIGEWIMNKKMAGIPIPRYRELAKTFNPVKFDAMEIAQLAKDAGMKYIVITAKHHDGFAMYHSKANKFNIGDASPIKVDPMKELAAACKEIGLGFGFYYSHNQDWTFPGGGNGPGKDAEGNPATFDDYFQKKCLPQVKEITSEYGPIVLVWFDTPGKMPKKYVQQLVDVVRENQPDALVSGRAGHNLGDYQSLGDMEVPHQNVEGLWEAVDTTNDSWGYAWYDQNWKTPKMVLERLISCVARGGTYMLNIGPRGDGSVPERAAASLRESGQWIRRYPQVVYAADASPWNHALPWGDVTVKENKMFLSVMEWPKNGTLYLPGLKTEIVQASLLIGDGSEPIKSERVGSWTRFELPPVGPDPLVSVIEVQLSGPPEADDTFGIDPGIKTEIRAEFAEVTGASQENKRWMEKFGEWKHVVQVTDWDSKDDKATWEVDVVSPGDYQIDLTYTGEGRLVWRVSVESGQVIQNQQNASQNYQSYPIGWLRFPSPGRYRVSASCIDGNIASGSLQSITFTPVATDMKVPEQVLLGKDF
jgi:alpha-L-fucosidase